jgi:hypothetical protein
VVSTISTCLFTHLPAVIPVKHVLSKRLKTTEISEKPCTDHIAVSRLGLPPNDVTRTRAHKNKVKVAVNRLSDSYRRPLDSGPCGTPDHPYPTEPRGEQCFL